MPHPRLSVSSLWLVAVATVALPAWLPPLNYCFICATACDRPLNRPDLTLLSVGSHTDHEQQADGPAAQTQAARRRLLVRVLPTPLPPSASLASPRHPCWSPMLRPIFKPALQWACWPWLPPLLSPEDSLSQIVIPAVSVPRTVVPRTRRRRSRSSLSTCWTRATARASSRTRPGWTGSPNTPK